MIVAGQLNDFGSMSPRVHCLATRTTDSQDVPDAANPGNSNLGPSGIGESQRYFLVTFFVGATTLILLPLLANRPNDGYRTADATAPSVSFRVNPNTATIGELSQLPDIGPSIASRIVESRETDGNFRAIEDLLRVRGIGPKSFTAMRPYLRIPSLVASDTKD